MQFEGSLLYSYRYQHLFLVPPLYAPTVTYVAVGNLLSTILHVTLLQKCDFSHHGDRSFHLSKTFVLLHSLYCMVKVAAHMAKWPFSDHYPTFVADVILHICPRAYIIRLMCRAARHAILALE